MSETIQVPKLTLQIVFDAAVESMDFGSGFLDTEEVDALREVAGLLGVDPRVATPDSHWAAYYGGRKPSYYEGRNPFERSSFHASGRNVCCERWDAGIYSHAADCPVRIETERMERAARSEYEAEMAKVRGNPPSGSWTDKLMEAPNGV